MSFSMSEVNVAFIETMLYNIKIDVLDKNQLNTFSLNLAKTLFRLVFESDILHDNHGKNGFNSNFEYILTKFYNYKPAEFQEFMDKMKEFKEDMISFDSIKCTDIYVDGVRVDGV